MNDKEQKYIDVAKKLLQQENTYTVISNSMKPLIKKDDKITCVRKSFDELKKYQIIAFKNGASGNPEIPTVHRIIKKEETGYKTKGDNALYSDKELVIREHFIGVVDKVIKVCSVAHLGSHFFLCITDGIDKSVLQLKLRISPEKGFGISAKTPKSSRITLCEFLDECFVAKILLNKKCHSFMLGNYIHNSA